MIVLDQNHQGFKVKNNIKPKRLQYEKRYEPKQTFKVTSDKDSSKSAARSSKFDVLGFKCN